MPLTGNGVVAGFTMEDELGITYLVENAQQFWSGDFWLYARRTMVNLLERPTGCGEKSSLKHLEQYLQSPLQLEHACEFLLDSELFQFHSERMCEILVDDLQSQTDPHAQFIFYHVLLSYGRRRTDFFRLLKRWQPLLPLIMDHILVEIDPDVEDTYFGITGGSNASLSNVPVPIEAKLRGLGIKLLYEMSRVQKLSVQDLRIFDDNFIEYLFDLVEQTRHMHDETFNYSVIKLIVSLNEQFMVASIGIEDESQAKNRVLNVLMRRLGSSKTFGENMIFMLNRAERTPEDLCMQLLILKILYALFTTKGTSEYFYTNDLCVLVDVFLRELVNLDEDSESLRHTYLRVLHPLLVKTQLRDIPYKRPQILYALESLIAESRIRDINPTTKRLVERCLSGDWCVNLKKAKQASANELVTPQPELTPAKSPTAFNTTMQAATQLSRSNSKTLKTTRSAENLRAKTEPPRPLRSPLDKVLRSNTNNASTVSLTGIAHAESSPTLRAQPPRRKATVSSVQVEGPYSSRHPPEPHVEAEFHNHHHQLIPPTTKPPHGSAEPSRQSPRRSAPPPPPPKRRKPPAVPTQMSNSGATITTIKSSESVPRIKVAHA
ncbi:hypothetical protein H0H92_010390 [Tricholoma furcatifolium]|nr:hypothetical protein H0H92_010390 [Tricholoma furcatifolium]